MRIPSSIPKTNKYSNFKVKFDGIVFDSKAEANRYSDLKLIEKSGQIKDLRTHPRYLLQEKFIDRDGNKIRAIHYFADFEYIDTQTGETVVEDVKGHRTPIFNLKKKMFLKKYPELKFVLFET